MSEPTRLSDVIDGMFFVMVCDGLGSGRPTVYRGMYAKSFDPEYARGRGVVEWTADPAEAMRFATQQDALDLWNTQSKTTPLRDDGQPNKPFTAYSVTITKL